MNNTYQTVGRCLCLINQIRIENLQENISGIINRIKWTYIEFLSLNSFRWWIIRIVMFLVLLIPINVHEHTVWTLLKTRGFLGWYLSDQRYWTSIGTKVLITESSEARLPYFVQILREHFLHRVWLSQMSLLIHAVVWVLPQSSVSSVHRFWISRSRSLIWSKIDEYWPYW